MVWRSRRFSAAMRSRASRRSVSIWVSPGPAGADAPFDPPRAQPLEVGPQPAHPGEVVLQLRELDLQLALGGVGVVGEDVEDDRRAVDHGHPERLLQVALLAGEQLVVAGHEVGVALADRPLELAELAPSEVAVGVGLLAPLHHLAGDGHAGGAQQLAQLGEVGLARRRGDAQRPLARPRVGDSLAVARLRPTAVSASVHRRQV